MYNSNDRYQNADSRGYAYADPEENYTGSASRVKENQNYANSMESMYYYDRHQENRSGMATPSVFASQSRAQKTAYAEPEKTAQVEYEENRMKYTTREDTRPSSTTMQFERNGELHDNPFEDYNKKTERLDAQYTVNNKGKVLIAVYTLVVATIFALIILNTSLLKSMNSTVAQKTGEITRLEAELRDLQGELDYAMSDEVIEEKAADMGMFKNR